MRQIWFRVHLDVDKHFNSGAYAVSILLYGVTIISEDGVQQTLPISHLNSIQYIQVNEVADVLIYSKSIYDK